MEYLNCADFGPPILTRHLKDHPDPLTYYSDDEFCDRLRFNERSVLVLLYAAVLHYNFAKQHLEPERMDVEELEEVDTDVIQHGTVAIMHDSIRMHVRIVLVFLKVTSYGYAYQCTLYNCLQCRFCVFND